MHPGLYPVHHFNKKSITTVNNLIFNTLNHYSYNKNSNYLHLLIQIIFVCFERDLTHLVPGQEHFVMKTKIFNLTNSFILLAIIAAWWITAFKIEPFLLYYGQQIGFNTSVDFFMSNLDSPGGISNYLADFTAQFFLFNKFGSFLIVAIAAVQGMLALNIVNRIVGKTKWSFAIFTLILLPGIMVLFDYHYPYHASIRLLFVFLFTWFFGVINQKFPKQSLFIWPVLALLLFYMASGAAQIVFAISSALILIHTNSKKIWLLTTPLFLLFSAAMPWIAYKIIFPANLLNLYRLTEIKHPEMLDYVTYYQLYAYYLILPVILVATFLMKLKPAAAQTTKHVKGKKEIKTGFFKQPFFILSTQVVFCALLGIFMFLQSFDSFSKKLHYIDYYAETGQWNEILKVAETINVYDFRVNYQIVRAYSQLGQLPDQLFNYPQLLGSKGVFFDTSTMNGSFTMPTSDLYFDLGFMSEAAHWAFEAQTLWPNSPRVLKRLVMINLVNRKYDLAGKFLKVLDQNMLYKDWVGKYEKYVSDTTLAANDKIIAEKRRFTPYKKAINSNPLENMMLLIDTNHDNRMAYDYLLTLCMLDSNFPVFVRYIQNYRYYGLKTLPRSWAEALSVYILKIKSLPPFVDDQTISKENMDRFKAFNDAMMKFNNNKEAAQNTMRRDFENTYWYYMLYLNPNVTNAFNKKSIIR